MKIFLFRGARYGCWGTHLNIIYPLIFKQILNFTIIIINVTRHCLCLIYDLWMRINHSFIVYFMLLIQRSSNTIYLFVINHKRTLTPWFVVKLIAIMWQCAAKKEHFIIFDKKNKQINLRVVRHIWNTRKLIKILWLI